jgi:hypothetical protein
MWATADDVKKYFQNYDFASGDLVTEDKVTGLLVFAKSYMESGLRVAYALPITDADDIKTLAHIQAKMVAGEIDKILRDSNKFSELGKNRELKEEAEKDLQDLISRTKSLKTNILNRVKTGHRECERGNFKTGMKF